MSYGKIDPKLEDAVARSRERAQPDPPDRAADIDRCIRRTIPPVDRSLARAPKRTTQGDHPMAAVPVTFQGILFFSDLGVGGGPMPGGPGVSHPIAPGGPPPGIWPSPGHPAHPIAPGGQPPGIWPSPGHPAHPIAPGGQPPGIWPSPGVPTHPIVIPPGAVAPGVPTQPIYWPPYPSQGPGFPTQPIYLPSGEGGDDKKWEIKPVWTPEQGWGMAIVPTDEAGPHPTPSDETK